MTDSPATAPETMLVILGAGASYDCIPGGFTDDWKVSPNLTGRVVRSPGLPDLPFETVRPPIAQGLAAPDNELINWTLNRWPWARPVVDHLRRTLTPGSDGVRQAKGLEAALRDYYDGRESVPEKERHLLAMRFYLRDLLWACTSYMHSPDLTGGVTNHLTLLRHLLDWARGGDRQVVIVSFNYDLIMERAMESSWDFSAGKRSSYLQHDRIKLVKPHGSAQWTWGIEGDASRVFGDALGRARQSIERAIGASEHRGLLECVPRATFENPDLVTDSHIQVPALAMPISRKSDFCWPPEQQDFFNDLPAVSKVLTIGWRGLEEHFLALLKPKVSKDTRLLVVSGGPDGTTEAESTKQRIHDHVRDGRYVAPTADGEGFSVLCSSTTLRGFLG